MKTFRYCSLLTAALIALILPSAARAIVGNVAIHGSATQSTTDFGGVASRGIDGNTNGSFGGGSVTHTADSAISFWEVDLGSSETIEAIRVFNRTDCCSDRLSNFTVNLIDASNTPVGAAFFATPPAGGVLEMPTGGLVGQKVRIQLEGPNLAGNNVLSLAEVEVLATNANGVNLSRGLNVNATQSSTAAGGVPERAVDGNTNGNFGGGSVTHTNDVPDSFWQVDLGETAAIENIRLFNRSDCCGDRLGNFRLSVLDEDMNEVFGVDQATAIAQGGNQNFLTDFGTEGRFVRVQLNDTNTEGNGVLSLAEVQVIGGTSPNVARNPLAVASQSSTGFGGLASRAIDGNTDGAFFNGSVTHTNEDAGAFWQVDLGEDYRLEDVILFNRSDCCGERLSDFRLSVLDDGMEVFGTDFLDTVATGGSQNFSLPQGTIGDTVRVQLLGTGFLSLAEVQVFGNQDFVPEPASATLLLLAGAGLIGRRRRRGA